MNLNFWLIQAFNGISYGALLFLLGSGLSLIFGVMRIVNLSHGSYFLLGGYVALTVIWTTGSWLLAIPVAALTIALLGLAMERIFLRPLGFDPLRQVLLTVGFAFLFQQAALDIWTGNNFDINPPEALSKSIQVGGLYLPLYRVFMIATAAAIGIVLWLAMEKTRLGRGGARHGRRCADGARRRHRHLARLDVHLRARRIPCGAGRRDRRRVPRRLSRPRLRDPAACLCRGDHRRHGQSRRRRDRRACWSDSPTTSARRCFRKSPTSRSMPRWR